MMKKFLLENFFVYYYFLEAICNDFISEEQKRSMFYSLADIFCLDRNDSLEEYYAQTCVEWVSGIKDYASYERVCRMLEFAELSEQNTELTELDRLTLMSKRTAMTAKDVVFKQCKTLTVSTVSDMLHKSASNGSVYAMGALSYMEYHGLCVPAFPENAVKRIRPCARWNDIFGNLLGIKYDKENLDGYYSRLYTILTRVNMCSVFDRICQYNGYTFKGETDKIANILYKAFAMNVVTKELYDRTFASMLFSDIIPLGNKERMAFGKQKEWGVDIPFHAENSGKASFDSTCADRLPIYREEESRSITRNLSFASVCPNNVCKPLLIASGDEFISDMYADMIKAGLGSPFVELDAAKLSTVDLSPTVENIFVRSIADTKASNTVFIIKNCEGLKSEVMGDMINFFDYGVRKNFNIVHSAVSLDLSGLRFVLLADEGGWQIKTLSGVCDTVYARRVSESEMSLAIDAVFTTKAASFGISRIDIDSEGYALLSRHSVFEVRNIVDEVIKDLVLRQDSTVTAEDIANACKTKNINRNVQGFGFTCGA